jgi:adenosylcobyric acid synthase
LPECDLIILPGSKATIADLEALKHEGWDIDIRAHARRGGRVLGLCGGYQMLGRVIADPDGIEGKPEQVAGLSLLQVDTVLRPSKHLREARGTILSSNAAFRGYEMHMGETAGPDSARPMLGFEDGRVDGAISKDGRIAGTYVHGLFTDDAQRAAFLAEMGAAPSEHRHDASIEATLDALAAHLEACIDIDRLISLAR